MAEGKPPTLNRFYSAVTHGACSSVEKGFAQGCFFCYSSYV